MASYEVTAELVDKFTEDEIKEYVNRFKEADADGSGYLEFHEMKELVMSLGMKIR